MLVIGLRSKPSADRSPYGQTNWPDILRSTATMVAGIMPPSQLLKKFASHPRQHDLVIALREIGLVERTLFIIDWLLDGVRVKYETARPRGNITAWRALISWPPSLSIGTQISLVRPLHSENAQGWIVPQASWRTSRPSDGPISSSQANIGGLIPTALVVDRFGPLSGSD